MLKKITHIILSFALFISTGGFSVSIHYCGNTLSGIAVGHEAKSCCDSGCNKCHTEYHYVKMKEDLTTPAQYQEMQVTQLNLQVLPVSIFEETIPEDTFNSTFTSESPPGVPTPEFIALNQAFLL